MRQLVSSSNLKALDYSEDTQELIVEFLNGSKYKYFDVPSDVVEACASAKSVGGYFIKNIRNNYDYEVMS